MIQVLSDVKEEDRNLTWAEIKERSSLAARARRDGGQWYNSQWGKHEELKKVFIHCKALSWVLASIFQFVFGVFLERQFYQ